MWIYKLYIHIHIHTHVHVHPGQDETRACGHIYYAPTQLGIDVKKP